MKKTRDISLLSLMVLLLVFVTHAQAALQSGVPLNTWVSSMTIANIEIVVPEDATRLTVSITEGSGDLDLYLKYGSEVSGGTISEIDADADIFSDGQTADELIILTPSTNPALRAGTWYIATLNYNDEKTTFTLTATIEKAQTLPLPAKQIIYPAYPPKVFADVGTDPEQIKPIAVGDIADGGETVSIGVELETPSGPYDAYFALHAPMVAPDEYFMLSQNGNLYPASEKGLIKWKQSASVPINEMPFGEFPVSLLPVGDYNLYFLLTAADSLDAFYLWSSYLNVPESVPDGSAGFFNGSLVVPNAAIIYQGEVYEGSVPLAEDGIAAITKDGNTYLYHPAMGKAELSEYNSRRAVGYFMAGVTASEVAAMRAKRSQSSETEMARVSPRSAGTTAAKLIGVGQTVQLGTGVDITLLDSTGRIKAVNKGRRFAVVKTGESKSHKYFLVPKSNAIPTEILDQLLVLGEVVIGDLDGVISKLDTERSDIMATDKIETFGAFVRMKPYFYFSGGWGKNQLEAIEKDKHLTALVNAVDLHYSTLEFFKNIVGAAIPAECVDIVTSGLFRHFQSKMMEDIGDKDAATKLDKALMYSVGSSFLGCVSTLTGATVGGSLGGPAGIGAGYAAVEAFNTFFDIVSVFNWVVEDVLFENFLAYTGTHFDAYDLALLGTGMVAYQYLDDSSGDTAQVRVLDQASGNSWHVAGGPGEYCRPKALSQNGVLLISCIDKEGDNDRLISVTDWGRGAQTNLPEACNVSDWYESSGAKADVDDSGRVFFQAEKAWYDASSKERIRNHGIYTVNVDGSDCRYIRIDIPPTDDTREYDRIYADSLAVTGDGQRVVFSENEIENVLVSVHPGGAYTKKLFGTEDRILVEDVSKFESGKVIFRYRPDPASSLFELGVMPIKGGNLINLSEVTGVTTILNSQTRNSCISPDGDWIAVRAADSTQTQNLLIIKSDGSEWRWLDTGLVAWFWDRCRFSPDGKSVIFSGFSMSQADIPKRDIYTVRLDPQSPDITNLTNTVDANETKPEI